VNLSGDEYNSSEKTDILVSTLSRPCKIQGETGVYKKILVIHNKVEKEWFTRITNDSTMEKYILLHSKYEPSSL
jgi:hypothetical protein